MRSKRTKKPCQTPSPTRLRSSHRDAFSGAFYSNYGSVLYDLDRLLLQLLLLGRILVLVQHCLGPNSLCPLALELRHDLGVGVPDVAVHPEAIHLLESVEKEVRKGRARWRRDVRDVLGLGKEENEVCGIES